MVLSDVMNYKRYLITESFIVALAVFYPVQIIMITIRGECNLFSILVLHLPVLYSIRPSCGKPPARRRLRPEDPASFAGCAEGDIQAFILANALA